MFDYDWFHGIALRQQCDEAKLRCARLQMPDVSDEEIDEHEEFQGYFADLQVRTLVYLRDGFSYEIKEIANVQSKSHLVFECEPVDHQYRVGSFVVSIPFDEIVRVEVFAVHPSNKPEDFPQITGFRASPEMVDPKHADPPIGPHGRP